MVDNIDTSEDDLELDTAADVADLAADVADTSEGLELDAAADVADANVGRQESAPWKKAPGTDLEAAAHRIVSAPGAEPPRTRSSRQVSQGQPATVARQVGPGHPPTADASEQLRASAPHTSAETPVVVSRPVSSMPPPARPSAVAETPQGDRSRVAHGRTQGLRQPMSHAVGETPSGGDTRAREQRMQPKGNIGALGDRMRDVLAKRIENAAGQPARERREPRVSLGEQLNAIGKRVLGK